MNCVDDHGCHDNATCTDDNGSYICVCKDGFTGDGFNCTGNRSRFHLDDFIYKFRERRVPIK